MLDVCSPAFQSILQSSWVTEVPFNGDSGQAGTVTSRQESQSRSPAPEAHVAWWSMLLRRLGRAGSGMPSPRGTDGWRMPTAAVLRLEVKQLVASLASHGLVLLPNAGGAGYRAGCSLHHVPASCDGWGHAVHLLWRVLAVHAGHASYERPGPFPGQVVCSGRGAASRVCGFRTP